MVKTHVLGAAEKKRRSRASKPSSYHVREREMSRRRMKIRRHMDKAQDMAHKLKRLLGEGDRKEIEWLSGHVRHCLLRDLFASRNMEYCPGILGDKRKLHRVITKMELNEIHLKVAEFEISTIEVDESNVNARLVNGSEGGVGGAAEEGAATRLTNTTQAPEAQAFCMPFRGNSRGLPDLQNGDPLEGDEEAHPPANGKAEPEIFVTREKESTDCSFFQFNGAANSTADSDRKLHDMHDSIGLTRKSTVAMDLSRILHRPPVGKSPLGMGGVQRRGMHGHATVTTASACAPSEGIGISRQHPLKQQPPSIACEGSGGMAWRQAMPSWPPFPSRTMDATGMPQINACGMDLQEMTITNYQATKTRIAATTLDDGIRLSGLHLPSVVPGDDADVAWRAMLSAWKRATRAARTSDALVGGPLLPSADGAKLQEMTMMNMNVDLQEGRTVKGSPSDRGQDAFAASRRPAPGLACCGEPNYDTADSPFKERITEVETIKRHIKDRVKDIIRRDIRRRFMSAEPFPERASSYTATTTNAAMSGSIPELEARQVHDMWATRR